MLESEKLEPIRIMTQDTSKLKSVFANVWKIGKPQI